MEHSVALARAWKYSALRTEFAVQPVARALDVVAYACGFKFPLTVTAASAHCSKLATGAAHKPDVCTT